MFQNFEYIVEYLATFLLLLYLKSIQDSNVGGKDHNSNKYTLMQHAPTYFVRRKNNQETQQ